jgi:hypothetical protein
MIRVVLERRAFVVSGDKGRKTLEETIALNDSAATAARPFWPSRKVFVRLATDMYECVI